MVESVKKYMKPISDTKKMKGVILAGGRGTRLRPATQIYNKHLVSILNKPMILYPLATLKTLAIKDILIVTGGDAIGGFADFLGDGSDYSVNLTYKVQKEAGGIAQALGLAEDFAKDAESIAVVLGDNIFDNKSIAIPPNYQKEYAVLFGKEVKDPERFGVMEVSKDGRVINIEEKPKEPKSNIVVTGLYIYPPDVFDVIKTLKPSERGELEITDVNNYYIKNKRCLVVNFKGFWHDAGTPSSLFAAVQWAYKNDREG